MTKMLTLNHNCKFVCKDRLLVHDCTTTISSLSVLFVLLHHLSITNKLLHVFSGIVNITKLAGNHRHMHECID